MSAKMRYTLSIALCLGSLTLLLIDGLFGDDSGGPSLQHSPPNPTSSSPTSTESSQPRAENPQNVSCSGIKPQHKEVTPPEAYRVHSAACTGDAQGLVRLARSEKGFTPHPEELAAMIARNPEILEEIAQILETEPIGDQGGTTYCLAETGRIVFARGTLDRPGRWTAYEPFAVNCAP